MKTTIVILLLLWAFVELSSLERRSLYFPDRQLIATPAVRRLEFEDLELKTNDDVKINAWFVPAAAGQHRLDETPVLLFCHGNAGNISHRLEKLQIFHTLGLGVLLFDYRGYGKSEGIPSEAGTYADADAAYRYLTETRKIPPQKIILYGESLGCAVAVEMARRHDAAALILESPFTSTVAMAKRVFPWLPVRWMVRYRYDNLSKIGQIKIPLLLLHSSQDEIVPFEMGQKLFAEAPEPKQFFELTGGHNDGYEVTGVKYVTALNQFVKGIFRATGFSTLKRHSAGELR